MERWAGVSGPLADMKKLVIAIILVTFGFGSGYYFGHHSSAPAPAVVPSGQSSASANELGLLSAKFHIPGSVRMPDANSLIALNVPRQGGDIILGFLHLTMTNLKSQPYLVRYHVYGYDTRGRRVSEGQDEFAIGSHESVAREIWLRSQTENLNVGSTFWVQMMQER
jgi:hypothetical protein